MTIRPVVTELFHADGRTDRHDEANSRSSFKVPGSGSVLVFRHKGGQPVGQDRYGCWQHLSPRGVALCYVMTGTDRGSQMYWC